MDNERSSEKIERDIARAIENGVHIDVVANPFLTEAERELILDGKMQDPEWD